MARLIRYVPSVSGIKRLRASREIDEHLERRADRVAEAAADHYRQLGHDMPVEVVQEGSDTPAPRARVAVIARSPAALKIEAQHRPLGGSLDAAREQG